MSTGLRGQSIGVGLGRLDGVPKVRGTALYAYEQPVPQPAYLHPVQATIAKGTVVRIDAGAAEAVDGVLTVLTPISMHPDWLTRRTKSCWYYSQRLSGSVVS